MDAGYDALSAGKWLLSIDHFNASLETLPVRDQNLVYIDRAKWGIAEANYQLSLNEYNARKTTGDLAKANELNTTALEIMPTHKASIKLQDKLDSWGEAIQKGKFTVDLKDTEEFTERKSNIDTLMAEGKAHLELRNLEVAEEKFEGVLFEDPFNKDAIRFLQKISEIKYEYATLERDFTIKDMMYQTRDRWNGPLGVKGVSPKDLKTGTVLSGLTDGQILEERMRDIIIPELEFRQANIVDVINFLVETSRSQDPQGVGVNIILNLNVESVEGAAAEAADDDLGGFGDDFGLEEDFGEGGGESSAAVSGVSAVTLNLRRVSLLDSLKFVTELTGLKYRVERGVVIIKRGGTLEELSTRFYPVDPALFSDFTASGGGDAGGGDGFGEFGDFDSGGGSDAPGSDIKSTFTGYGVPFPPGSSIIYNPLISQIIVANTVENLEKFEDVLAKLNITPRQIEIEAKFVEVIQTDLEELGFEWIFTDDVELASKDGNAPLAQRERIQLNADDDGFSKGLRFASRTADIGGIAASRSLAGGAGFQGGIATFASVLTNPELTMVIHALDQKGNADVLSAPRVTTLNGVNAAIEVVTEIIYPTEFEISEQELDISTDNDGTGNTRLFIPPPTVVPGAFETRETGVILNVTPTVNADNYTISLTLIPEISELVDWIQYGSEYQTGLEEGDTSIVNIPQPVFSSRNVTTSMIVWDGHTVVMGGLIREEVISFEDKIPILGDIPLIGRLFRSEGEQSQKRNLMIFVTATLVNPAGEPINKNAGNREVAAAE